MDRGEPPPWQPWAAVAGFAFLLHFAWEMLQFPLYAGMAAARHDAATWTCVRATLGDVLIALLAFAAASVAARSRLWFRRRPGAALAVYLASGLGTTIVVEVLSVSYWRRWAYAPAMPMVLGVGLAPLAQWVVVPLLTVWLVRRHIGVPPGTNFT
jgi:hypothetical protein